MKNPNKLTKLMTEILNDTVRFYSKNPLENRAVDNGDCLYHIPNSGAKCAIGRLLNEADLANLEANNQLHDTPIVDIYEKLTTEKVKILPVLFLMNLQDFHDEDQNWEETRISLIGKTQADHILAKINSSYYD